MNVLRSITSLLIFTLSLQVTTASVAEGGTYHQALQEMGYQSLAVNKLPTGHDYLPVTFNDYEGHFILDTGATSVLNDRLADRFGWDAASSHRHLDAAGIGGPIRIAYHRPDQVVIAGLPVALSEVGVTDLNAVSQGLLQATGVLIEGLVGQDLLISQSALLDVGQSQLYLSGRHVPVTHFQSGEAITDLLSDHGYQRLPMKRLAFSNSPLVFHAVEVEINGQSGILIMDSGAGRSMLHRKHLAHFNLADDDEQNSFTSGAGGNLAISQCDISLISTNGQQLKLDAINVGDLTVLMNYLKTQTGVLVHGVLGQDVLQAHQAIIHGVADQWFVR